MKIEVVKGDITTMDVDAIVNAANSSLLGGSGVDGAVHRKGGHTILEECRQIVRRQGKCRTGEAVITTAGNLPSKYVIHTVGPVYNMGGKEKEIQLKNCYINALKLLFDYDLKSIAFPNISTGIYRFPKVRAAEIAISAIKDLDEEKMPDRLVYVCFEDDNYEIYKELLK